MEIENEELVIELNIQPAPPLEVEVIIKTDAAEEIEELKEDIGDTDTDLKLLYQISKL